MVLFARLSLMVIDSPVLRHSNGRLLRSCLLEVSLASMVWLVSTDQLIQHVDAGDFEIIKELNYFRDETAQRH